MTQRFRILISGRSLSGAPLATLKEAVARTFRLDDAAADKMLCGQPVVVSRNATAEAAEKLIARLRALDLEARSEPLPPPAAAPADAPAPPAARPASAAPPAGNELFALDPIMQTAPPQAQATEKPAAPGTAQPLALVDAATAGPGAVDTSCPRCGEIQPPRTLCRKCGLDMPRYHAAQQAAAREARAEREMAASTQQTARRASPADSGDRARLLGLGWSGRIGRLDYLAGSCLCIAILGICALLALKTGKTAFFGLGILLSTVYGFRVIALRLHDTNRTGWLSLAALVPILGGLMSLALLFVPGDDGDNDYGDAPGSSGARVFGSLLVMFVIGSMTMRGIEKDPEQAARLLAAASFGPAQPQEEDFAEDDLPAAHYASNNRIDIYVATGCTQCDDMLAWLRTNQLRHTLYVVDRDQAATERLHSIVGSGRVMLPVLEVNGHVLPGDPGVSQVHRALRQASP